MVCVKGRPATQLGLAVAQDYIRARRRCCNSSRQSSAATTDDKDITVQITFFKPVRCRSGVDNTQTRHNPDQRLPQVQPRVARWAHEGAIIEPDRHETPQPVKNRVAVMGQRTGDVLSGHHHPVPDQRNVSCDIGLSAHLNQRRSFVCADCEYSAWTVIFEGPRQHPLIRRGKGACNRVAVISGVLLPLKAEFQLA